MVDRILVVLDDLKDWPLVLPHLQLLAHPPRVRVFVMKTIPFLETLVEMPHELAPEAEGDDTAAEVYVEAVVDSLRDDGIDADGFTHIGRSGLSIAAAAERVDASLIVIVATRSSGRLASLIHAAAAPVYVIPAGESVPPVPVELFAPWTEASTARKVDQLLGQERVPVLLIRRSVGLPRPEETGVFRIPYPAHQGMPLGVALWNRHVPAIPLMGLGEP